jgi:hypothetical protein
MATWRAPPVSAPESDRNSASAKSSAASDNRIARAASAWVRVSITHTVVVATVALVFGMLSLSKLEGPVCNRTRVASLTSVGIIDQPVACPYLSGSQLP